MYTTITTNAIAAICSLLVIGSLLLLLYLNHDSDKDEKDKKANDKKDEESK